MKNLIFCLRCKQEMSHTRTEKLQLGETSWIFGNIPNLKATAPEDDIFSCSACGKPEFFLPNSQETDLPQKRCPVCGHWHDFDDPKCPFCKQYQN